MKYFVFILCLIFSLTAKGTRYYVSNTGSNGAAGTSPATAWQTLSKVQTAGNAGTIDPGDTISFKRGDVWYEKLRWWAIFGGSCPSGTPGAPIVFNDYGTGALPRFAFPIGDPTAADSRNLFEFLRVDWIVCENLNVTDTVVQNKIVQANTTAGFLLGAYPDEPNFNCIIKNCTMSNIGLGVVITGDSNTVQGCTITDLKNVVNTLTPDFEDYGANCITLTGKRNYIINNFASGGWCESIDFGWSGGFLEAFDTNDTNFIMYNTIVDCGGVAEFGAFAGASTCTGNLFAFNKIINVGGVSYVNVSGTFAIEPNNNMFFSNVIIENDSSRFSGPNTGAGNTEPVSAETLVFNNNGSPAASVVWNLQNNIIVNYNNMDVMKTGSVAKTTHLGNLYKLSGGSAPNYTLNAGEGSSSAANWTDTTSTYPYLWNFNLLSTSPARGIGEDLASVFAAYGLDYNDFANTPVTTPYDAGILQYIVPPTYRNNYSKKNKRYQNAP